jgi:hypothetical protein
MMSSISGAHNSLTNNPQRLKTFTIIAAQKKKPLATMILS